MLSIEDFFRAAQRARGRASQAHADGLSLSQYHVMAPLADAPQGVTALAIAAGVAAPTATRTLDALVRDGLVTRTQSEDDRRCVSVSLTPEGRRALTQTSRVVADARGRIADTLAPDEQAQAAAILDRLATAIEEQW
jgi:DNA-binding MarR family transcriptional regulator